MKNLFKPFFKTTDKDSRERNKQSHGLGLSICKTIAEKLNGDLEVFSKPGEGSTFVFSLIPKIVFNPKVNMKKQPRKLKKKNELQLQLEEIKESENELESSSD